MKLKMVSKLALLVAMVVLVGCAAQTIDQGYKTLAVSKITYDTTLTMAGDLYRKGVLDEKTKEQAIEYGSAYMLAHNQATVALLEFQILLTKEAKDKTNETMALVASTLSKFLDFLTPYITKEMSK